MKYETVQDAHTALINGGFLDWFSAEADLWAVATWMWRNEKTDEEAAGAMPELMAD